MSKQNVARRIPIARKEQGAGPEAVKPGSATHSTVGKLRSILGNKVWREKVKICAQKTPSLSMCVHQKQMLIVESILETFFKFQSKIKLLIIKIVFGSVHRKTI